MFEHHQKPLISRKEGENRFLHKLHLDVEEEEK